MPSTEGPRPSAAHAGARALRGRRALVAAIVAAGGAWAPPSVAQQQAQGFAVERLVQSAPGAGWLVMDDVSLRGGLGGAVSLSLGYAHRPFHVSQDGSQRLSVVQHQAMTSVALAVTWDRFRLYTTFSSPLYVSGQSGTVGATQFTGPSANLEQNPDVISDVQLGFDARLLGDPSGPARLGASAQLFFPSGDRADYLTDDTYRAAGRLLFAGDSGRFAYAGHLGVHVRPLDDAKIPDSPRGSELLFGAAAGMRLPGPDGARLLVGTEIFGATALRAFLGGETSALEGLLTARLDGSGLAGGTVRIKLGVGAGLHPRFGAPEWRAVVGVELFGRLTGPSVEDGSPSRR
jgi:hypothetical protein